MPIGYLDVATGADLETKQEMVSAMYRALMVAYPFPVDHRIFVREWAAKDVSQDGGLGSEPIRPALVLHVPDGADPAAKRTMLAGLQAAISAAYDDVRDFAVFLHEHPLDNVAINGLVLGDDARRVEEQQAVYTS